MVCAALLLVPLPVQPAFPLECAALSVGKHSLPQGFTVTLNLYSSPVLHALHVTPFLSSECYLARPFAEVLDTSQSGADRVSGSGEQQEYCLRQNLKLSSFHHFPSSIRALRWFLWTSIFIICSSDTHMLSYVFSFPQSVFSYYENLLRVFRHSLKAHSSF